MKTTIFKPAPLGSLVLETRILTGGTRFDAMTQDNAGSGAVIAAGFVPSSVLADPGDTGRTTVLSDTLVGVATSNYREYPLRDSQVDKFGGIDGDFLCIITHRASLNGTAGGAATKKLSFRLVYSTQ